LLLLSASPDLNAVVRGPHVPIRLRFNSPIDLKNSSLSLAGPDGEQRALALSSQTSPDVLVSDVRGLAPGSYVLHWEALGANDRITRGEVQFHVR